ncbi:MAG: hypothetical protein EBS97_09090 [Verrucomicrobia bacterium]|nr:hypothetical protein [Verrucomicrobiota bacterium]NBT23465.1 hypothetical protein [bacterium]NBV96986.1 hypothetical protein [Verrucomicrobiota bacterium]
MRSFPLHLLGKFFAVLTLLSFFLPWVRFSPSALKKNTLELVRSREDGPTFFEKLVWMRGAEWPEMWADPADGFSGFQLAFGAASGTQRAKMQSELASIVLDKRENRPLLGWLLLIPVLVGMGWLGLLLRRGPAIVMALIAVGLLGMYGVLRLKMAEGYSDRLIAQIQLGVGWWGALYGMLGLAFVCLIFLGRVRGRGDGD